MSLASDLAIRSNNVCELCNSENDLSIYLVPPKVEESKEHCLMICQSCKEQVNGEIEIDANHWRCLNESIWSESTAVKVLAHRMLKRLETEAWAQDLLGMMYLEEDVLEWAESENTGAKIIHKDANGKVLQAGDSVVLIQDLKVKGANFTAKRGTSVRRISLDRNNANHIEGRVNNQHIVILTQYVKKSN